MFKSLLLVSLCVLVIVECSVAEDHDNHRVAQSFDLRVVVQLFQQLAGAWNEVYDKQADLVHRFVSKFITKAGQMLLSDEFQQLFNEGQKLQEESQRKFSGIVVKFVDDFLKMDMKPRS